MGWLLMALLMAAEDAVSLVAAVVALVEVTLAVSPVMLARGKYRPRRTFSCGIARAAWSMAKSMKTMAKKRAILSDVSLGR
ncbi:hypothetical protein C7G49_19415 [Acinetobacter pittii]|nr:hypothetical protein C7G49_19415 [Acinetobacter pittii]